MAENWFKIFEDKMEQEMTRMKTANIMIIGKTGVGKSTLINNVFRERLVETGIGKPVTQHLKRITKEGVPLVIYDTKGLELEHQVQQQIKDEILGEVHKKLANGKADDYIHVVWYCINANSNRIETFEEEWIREFAKDIPVILVLTQCMDEGYMEFQKYIEGLNLPIQDIVATLAEPRHITRQITIPAFGLERLVHVTYGCMADAAKQAFINAQMVDIERKARMARSAVSKYVAGAFATGFTPIPFADSTVLVPAQIGMIAHLTAIFGINMEKNMIVALVSAIGGSGGAAFLGKTLVANALKFFPGIGTLAGGTISGSTAAILTAGLGYAYVEVLKRLAARLYAGETIDEQEIIDVMRSAYQEQLKKGKSLIRGVRMEEDGEAKESDSTDDFK